MIRERERIEFPLELLSGVTAAGFDESKVKRYPEGTPVSGKEGGGRFAPKGDDVFVSEPEDWSTVLSHQAEMEKLWREQTQLAEESFPGQVPLNDPEAIAAKVFVQDAIAGALEGDEDFKSLIVALDPYGDYKSDFEPGGKMQTADTVEKQVAALSIATWARTSGDTDPISLQFQIAAEQEFGLEANPFVHRAYESWVQSTAVNNDMTLEYALAHPEELTREMFTDQQMRGARKFVRTQYDLTQGLFQRAGISEVYAYRGMRFDGVDTLVPPPQGIRDSLKAAKERYLADEESWMAEARKDSSDDNLRSIGRAPRFQDYAGQDIISVHQNPLSSWAHSFNVASTFANGGVVGAVAGTRIDVRRIVSTPFTGFGCLDENEMVVLGGTDMDAMVWSWASDNWRPESDSEFQEQWAEAATRAYEARREARVSQSR